MAEPFNAAVIGGGISGLACAYRLRQLSIPTVLFEAEDRVGGLIGTVEKDGFLFEAGPQSFQGTEFLLDLIREISLEAELCEADARAPRFVLRHGKLEKVPMTPQAIIASSLLGVGSRWKVVSEPLRRTKPPSEEESVANFVRRKFGHEILEYLVSPFVSGVYAGDPEKLSLKAAFPTLDEWERAYGSVLRGAIKSRPKEPDKRRPTPLCSFEKGVGTLARMLAEKSAARIHTGTRVCAIVRDSAPGGGYQIQTESHGRMQTFSASAIIVAAPAYAASHFLGSISASLANTLSGIAYASVAVVASGYFSRQIPASLDGFGFLVPRSEKLRILGTVWNSSLFPGRAPKACVAMTSFIGGATDADIASKPEREIAAIVQADNAKALAIAGEPTSSAVWKHPKALPQYNLGHGHNVEAIRAGERQNPGLFFSGNYLEGPSLGKCVEHGFKTAEAAGAFLRSSQ